MTRLCVALTEKTTDGMLAAMRALPPGVDTVEVRLDAMEECDLARLCAQKTHEIIVTNRRAAEGGIRQQSDAVRLNTLRQAAAHGAEFVDVELACADGLGPLPAGTGRIVSCHDFDATPSDLDGIVDRIRAAGADVAKVAVAARSIADTASVQDLLRRRAGQGPLIALSMGEAGVAGRVLAPKFGAFLTFASPRSGAESAPGQVPVDAMLGMYRFHAIGPATEVYGVVANPVAHSMSPAIHNAAFATEQMDAVYLPFLVDDPAAFLAGFCPFDLHGLSVTLPHKETMLGLVDTVDDLSSRIGAINTVLFDGTGSRGCNTDVAAAVGSIEDAARAVGMVELRGRHVLLVGAGGAARAIAYGLREKGADLTVANRTLQRAERLAAELGAAFCPLDAMVDLDPDILVNATSRGMWPEVDDSPIPRTMLREGLVVFDSVYNPIRTRLLREAEEAGCRTASGLEWFVRQAAAQFEFWTKRPAPVGVMEKVVRERLSG